ncbi:MAG TPA: 2Fe-2S iron-sulfur cluster-binding protein [Candidatus Acidoferrum sp.]|nr:2Fe-2S iron-sulfur cluster-binding protein [Candidatus Acidoferrum sp.]
MKLTVNGKQVEVPAGAMGKRIIEFLREDLDLTGAKNACDIGACGACTILVNDEPMRICVKRVKDLAGQRLTTIEGLEAPDGALHPLQQAFVECGAIQCGFCTPGMVLTAHAFLLKNPRPTRDQIRRAIHQNLCRCTGYQQIVNAVERAAPHYRQAAAAGRDASPARPGAPETDASPRRPYVKPEYNEAPTQRTR